MSARPGPSGGYRASGIPTGIAKPPADAQRIPTLAACFGPTRHGIACAARGRSHEIQASQRRSRSGLRALHKKQKYTCQTFQVLKKISGREEKMGYTPGVNIDFAGAAKVIETAAQLVKTVAESIRDAVQAGVTTIDLLAARKAENHLTKMHVQAIELFQRQSAVLIPSAEKFIRVPTAQNWDSVRSEIKATLKEVEPLTKGLIKHRANFILESTYSALLQAMKDREIALAGVLSIPVPPSSGEDLEQFRGFLAKYLVLVRELRLLDLAIAEYLRKSTAPSASQGR